MTSRTVILGEFDGTFCGVRVESRTLPDLAPGQIRIRLEAAPVNPADLNIVEGKYGALPALPAVVGNESSGRVVASRHPGFAEGALVAAPGPGAWAEFRDVPGDDAVALAEEVDPIQASMLSVNPPTALAMLESTAPMASGDWVIQNAANSGVGRAVVAIAKELGLRTVNVVRRHEAADELLNAGADRAIAGPFDYRAGIEGLCEGARPKLALNAVGGGSALDLANALADGGTHVTYGAMARQPLKIPNGLLIFRDLRFRGFWLKKWLAACGRAERAAVFERIAGWAGEGKFAVPVAATYPLESVRDALAASAAGAQGKIVLVP